MVSAVLLYDSYKQTAKAFRALGTGESARKTQ
jgi:hypothetical protein